MKNEKTGENMKLDNFTFKAQEVLADAQARAEEEHQQEIAPEHLLLALVEQKDGVLTASMDSPDQGAKDIPVDEVIFENGNLRLEIKSAMIVFEGKLKDDDLSIEGELRQSGQSFPLVLKRVDEPAQVRRPQEPKKPYPYEEEEVVYENKEAAVKLAGTLTSPGQGGPFP
ncbi:unnamed protein product, partial [marine sediment metagenome]